MFQVSAETKNLGGFNRKERKDYIKKDFYRKC